MNQTDKEDNLDQAIMKLVQEKKPKDVLQLVSLIKSENMFISEQEIMKHVFQLQSQGQLKLKGPKTPVPPQLSTYLMTLDASWYWIIIILALLAAVTVFIIPENSLPLIYIRNILGVIFILFLPGYSLIKLLFPKKELNSIECIALSIGMSIALVPIAGLILNYTPWGITTAPITIILLALTTILATVAIAREHQYKIKKRKTDIET